MNRQKYVVDLVKAAFIALIIKVMASTSDLVPWNSLLDNLLITFAICVMLAKLWTLTLGLGKLMILGSISLLALYTCVSMQMYDLLVTVIAICLLIDEDLEEYISLMLKIQAAILIGHVAVSSLLSLAGSAHRFWLLSDNQFRFTGGFSHSNVLSCYIVSCMLMFVWKRFRHITSNQFGWMACIAVITFLTSRSRTGLLLNLFLLLLIYLTQQENRLTEKALSLLLPLIFPGLTAIIFFAQKLYVSGNSAALFLDDLLTGRIKFAAYAYIRSGVSWLPRYLDYVSSRIITWTPEWRLSGFTFDNLYAYLFIQIGIIWIIIITVLIAVACKKFDFRNKVFLLFWMLFGVVEVHGLNCFEFFPLLLMSTLLSEKGAGDHPSC